MATFSGLISVAVDAEGNVYISDNSTNRINKIAAGGVVTTLAGCVIGFADGTATAAKFKYPSGVVVDARAMCMWVIAETIASVRSRFNNFT